MFDTSGSICRAVRTLPGRWLGHQCRAGGKAQATTQASQKIYNFIQATGEFFGGRLGGTRFGGRRESYMVSYSVAIPRATAALARGCAWYRRPNS